uniref:sulfite exporter TauE/SafE family protein n=1 Tax=Ornithobacterium rhinotracheale TaxID=28251 RepID=UPI0039A782C3
MGVLIISALILGLGNSLHCVGMCGPIAFSLGLSQEKNAAFYTKNLLYHLGRITTYSLLGILVGFIGKGISLAGFHGKISIVMGILMIIYALLPKKTITKIEGLGGSSRFLIQLKSALGEFIQKKSYLSLYTTGILNGLLPCGAVYIALIAAIATQSIAKSAMFMAFFGLGTVPLMFLAVFLGASLNLPLRNKLSKILPYLIILVGILFIIRGLELGIPFLSPPASALDINENPTPFHCH